MIRSIRALSLLAWLLCGPLDAATLFNESFDDPDFASRGWYDVTSVSLSTAEHIPGSLSSAEYHFPLGATSPGGAMRMLFTPSDSVYLSYYVKYSASYTGSDRPYHPHEFHFITDVDSMWIGPAYTHLTLYIEQNEGEPLLAIQDGQNIDEANIGVDLTSVTEARAVAGCNGDSDGHGDGGCYAVGAVHRNGKGWRGGLVVFGDDPGPHDKNAWHFVEAYFGLNSVPGGMGVADGSVRYWFDGVPLIDHDDVMLRTGLWPTMPLTGLLAPRSRLALDRRGQITLD